MPKKPGRFCKVWGCGEIVRGGSYCAEHQAERQQEYDRRRGSSAGRGYGANWRRIRKIKLMRSPICEDPYGLHGEQVVEGGVVDHITPLARGGTNAFENLQTLCTSCHGRKTASEDGGFGNKGRGGQISGDLEKQNRAGGFGHTAASKGRGG